MYDTKAVDAAPQSADSNELKFEWSRYGCKYSKLDIKEETCKSPSNDDEYTLAIQERVNYLKSNGFTPLLITVDPNLQKYCDFYPHINNQICIKNKSIVSLNTDTLSDVLTNVDRLANEYHYSLDRNDEKKDNSEQILKVLV